MPNQPDTMPAPADACPVCHAHTGDGVSLYAPDGAVLKPANGHTEPYADPVPGPLPTHDPTLDVLDPQPPTQSIQFWQGLAAGLGTAIVILFLIATVLAS